MLVAISFFIDHMGELHSACVVVPVVSVVCAVVTVMQFGDLLPDGQNCHAGPSG